MHGRTVSVINPIHTMSYKKYFFLMAGMFLLSGVVSGQDKKDDQKMTKAEKKEARQEELVKQKEAMLELILSRYYVLEASSAQSHYGDKVFLTPMTNFVSVNSDNATIQLAFEQLAGWNGIGGITLDGTITSYKVNEGKPGKSINVQMRVAGAGIASHQFITIEPSGDASLEIQGDKGQRIIFNGKIVPFDQSGVYKGMPSNR